VDQADLVAPAVADLVARAADQAAADQGVLVVAVPVAAVVRVVAAAVDLIRRPRSLAWMPTPTARSMPAKWPICPSNSNREWHKTTRTATA